MELNRTSIGILSAIAITMAPSCSVDEDFSSIDTSGNDRNNTEIRFNVQTDMPTRANARHGSGNFPNRFKITAYEGADNFYGGQADVVTSSDNGATWNSECRRFWPGDRPEGWRGLTFYAYIDGNGTSRSASGQFDISGEAPVISNFEVDKDVALQRDLMYAVAKNVNRKSNNGKVSLNFRHALSQICFTARNCNPAIDDIEIISIELGGVKGRGSYLFPSVPTQGGLIVTFSDGPTEGWNIDMDSEDCSYTLPDINLHLGSAGETGRGELKYISINNFPEEADTPKASMLLLPQTATARVDCTSGSGAYLEVKIKKTFNGKTVPEIPETVYVPLNVNWSEGRRYTYDLCWKSSSIAFSVTESDFTE